MKNTRLIVLASLTLAGCTAATSTLPPPRMTMVGDIRPCSPDRRDSPCGNAIYNATLISHIHEGQTPDDVRAIMRHDAESLEMSGANESWGYMTSNENRMMTWITFTDQRVSSVSHEVIARN